MREEGRQKGRERRRRDREFIVIVNKQSVLIVLDDYYCLFTYLFTNWLLLLCFHSFPPAALPAQANSAEDKNGWPVLRQYLIIW